MPFLPRQITSLLASDPTLARVNNNVRAAIQPTLDFLQTYFGQGADGTLRLLRNTIVNASWRVLGPTFLQGDVTINGNVFCITRSANGFCITPAGGGNPALYVTNAGNSVVLWSVNTDGSCTAPSFISASGFKSSLEGGSVSAANGATATYFQHQKVLYRGGSVDQQNLVQPMGFSGSVIGIAVQYQGTTTGQNISVKVQKNNADLWVFPNILTSASSGALTVKTVAKGLYPFATSDFLTVLSSFSAGGDIRFQATLFIEQAA